MVKLNQYLIDNTPRSNIIEWATKEDCWQKVKTEFHIPDTTSIKDDIASKEAIELRYADYTEFDTEYYDLCKRLILAIEASTWDKIAEWGKDTGCLTLSDQNSAKNIAHKIKFDYELNKRELNKAIAIYEITSRNNYEIFESELKKENDNCKLSTNTVMQMIAWEKTLLVLDGWQYKILQQSILSEQYSELRESELLLIIKQMRDKGFVLN